MYVLGGPEILLPIGCVKMRWKNCVLQPAAGKRTQLFHLIFTAPGVHLLVQPCIRFNSWKKVERCLNPIHSATELPFPGFEDAPGKLRQSTKWQKELYGRFYKLLSESSTDIHALLSCSLLPRQAAGGSLGKKCVQPLYTRYFVT